MKDEKNQTVLEHQAFYPRASYPPPYAPNTQSNAPNTQPYTSNSQPYAPNYTPNTSQPYPVGSSYGGHYNTQGQFIPHSHDDKSFIQAQYTTGFQPQTEYIQPDYQPGFQPQPGQQFQQTYYQPYAPYPLPESQASFVAYPTCVVAERPRLQNSNGDFVVALIIFVLGWFFWFPWLLGCLFKKSRNQGAKTLGILSMFMAVIYAIAFAVVFSMRDHNNTSNRIF